MIEVYGSPRAIKLNEPEVKARRDAFAERNARCMLCWIPYEAALHMRFPEGLQTHELVGGSMRSMEDYNYLRLCARCHAIYHDGIPGDGRGFGFGVLLYCKYEYACLRLRRQFNPNYILEGLWNWHRLGYLYRPQRRPVSAACLPCMESPPATYLEERSKWTAISRSPLPLGSKPFHKLDPAQYAEAGERGILLLKKPAGSAIFCGQTFDEHGVLSPLSPLEESRLIATSSEPPSSAETESHNWPSPVL